MRSLFIVTVSSFALLIGGCGSDSEDSATAPVNIAPVVNAGVAQSVTERQTVQLSGSASDADSSNLTIEWTQINGPMVELSAVNTLNPTFQAPNVGDSVDITLRLSVSDGTNTRSSDVVISVADTNRDGTSPQGIPNDQGRRDRARNGRDNNRPMIGGVEVRTYDGTNNNLTNTSWGASFEHLQRLGAADYADSISSLAGANRKSAREISNLVHNQDEAESIPNTFGGSDFVWQWGQFMDHDLDLTDGAEESADIVVLANDALFDPNGTGSVVIPFNRALFDPSTGTDANNPREQENEITSWIDGSMVYGSSDERRDALKDPTNPHLLATSDGNLLPFNTAGLSNANIGSEVLFLAGDVRANEQVGLTVMHTLLVREHNRMAANLMDNNPNADPEDIFETARRLLVGKIQYITYNEWLPTLIGTGAIPAYAGYDDTINPTIFNEFSVAAFRLGHTMLNEQLLRLDEDGEEIAEGHVDLMNGFFAGTNLLTDEDALSPFLRGFASQAHQAIDVKLVNDVRNFLFGPPGAGGLDLASLNLQRGRDHGVPSYNAMRTAMGLTARASFAEVSSDATTVAALEAAYDNVDDIDLWTGGLAEDASGNSQLGELFQAIMVKQFTDIRDGDRFWYENYLDQTDINIVESTSLSEIIRDNTDIGNELQGNVFRVPTP